MPSRRDLLRTTGGLGVAGLAGCTALGNSNPSSDRDDESAPPADATHRVRVTSTDDPPDLPVDPSVEGYDWYATPDGPPALRVTIRNTTDEAVTVGEARDVQFQYVDSGAGVTLLPYGEPVSHGSPARARSHPVAGDGCWRLTEEVLVDASVQFVEIPADGTRTTFVGVYGSVGSDACLPAGDHRFASRYTVATETPSDGTDTAADWGFSLSVEEL